MTDAVDYHEQEAKVFKDKYLNKKAFRSRLEIWEKLIKSSNATLRHSMDLGCGPGWMTKILCGVSTRVTAIDGSAEMIAQSRSTLGSEANKVEFVNGLITPALLDKWSAGSFDLIISSSVLEYVENAELILSKSFSLLSPKGRLVFSLPNSDSIFRKLEGALHAWLGWPHYRGLLVNIWAEDYTRKVLEDLGFQVESVQFQGYIPIYSELFFWLPDRLQKPLMIFVSTQPKA